MSLSGAQLEGIIDSIARRVTLRASTPVYLTIDRNLRVLGAFNCIEQKKRAQWAEQAFKARAMLKTILTTSVLPKVHRALKALKKNADRGNKREVAKIAEDIVEHGIAYNNVKAILDAANEVFDANYNQYATVPISDFAMPKSKDDEEGDEQGKLEFLSTFTEDLEKQERAAHASMETIRKMRPHQGKDVGDMTFTEVLKMSRDEWSEILNIAEGVEEDG